MKFLFQNPIPKILKVFSNKERLTFYIATIVFVSTTIVYGAWIVKTEARILPAEGGTYREGVVGQPAFINPVIPTTETDLLLSRLIFSSLTEMAELIKKSDDGTTWNVRLQDGIFWHDGEKVTADDVVFSVDVIHDPESRSPLRSSFEGVTASRVSELEVEFVLQNPYAFFEEDHLSSLRPIPEHIFGDIPVTNYKLSRYGLGPVGSGPYLANSHNKDARGFIESFTLEVNQDYFERPAYIEKLVFKFYKKDPELISAYNLGQIDGFGLSTSEPLSERPIIIRHEMHELESSRYYAIFINQNLAPEDLQGRTIRRALSAAVDRDDIINSVFDGAGVPLFGPTTLTLESKTNSSSEPLEGLELSMVVPDEAFLVATAEEVKNDWELLGITVNLEIRSLRDIQEEVLRNTNYQMILFGNIVKKSNDLFAFWHSSKRFFPDQNLALYQDDVVDGLLETYRKTFDEKVQSVVLEDISDRIANDLPAVFLYSPNYVYITTPSLGGFDDAKLINTSDDRFSDITDWFVKSKRSFRDPVLEEVVEEL